MQPAFECGEVIRYGETRYDRRFRLVELADMVVLQAGSNGTQEIYFAALTGGKPVLPIGGTIVLT
jgi:hypothetical protein